VIETLVTCVLLHMYAVDNEKPTCWVAVQESVQSHHPKRCNRTSGVGGGYWSLTRIFERGDFLVFSEEPISRKVHTPCLLTHPDAF